MEIINLTERCLRYEIIHNKNRTEENTIITNDEEAYQEHQHYKKNKKLYEERLKNMDPDLLEFEKRHQERLKIEMRMPATVKIDDYLEKFKIIRRPSGQD